MTVADLIRELQAMPNQNVPVRVLMRGLWTMTISGPDYVEPTDEEADEADEVRYEGNHVLIRGR